jgi:hypothetical protein
MFSQFINVKGLVLNFFVNKYFIYQKNIVNLVHILYVLFYDKLRFTGN